MKRHLKMQCAAGLCCGLGLLLANLTWAQQPAAEPGARAQRTAQQHEGQKHACLATDLIGMTVKVKGEEDIGQIQNLVINSDGQVQYLALTAAANRQSAQPAATDRVQDAPAERVREGEGVARTPRATAASTGHLTLVPWDAAEFHEGETKSQKYVSIDIEKDRLMQAPSFTQQQLTAQQNQTQWMSQVDQFFNSRQQRGAARPNLNRNRQDDESRQSPEEERKDD